MPVSQRCCVALLLLGTSLCNASELDFNRDVRPILSDRCFACHGPDADNQDSEFRIDTLENATVDLGGYAGIVPGDLAASEVHLRIHDADDPMPPVDALKQLTDADREILDQWIQDGAAFDVHWAFQPLPKIVQIPDANGARQDLASASAIDRFIAAAHAKRDLSPAKPASREKWLRRVTFDLTGLPPTIKEVQRFVADQSADAHEKVIDGLLASQASAERLASEWLDVARYADSYGYQRDDARFVWPYRDWVISAFSEAMPYDQFIMWQLAGDLLPNATDQQRLATTFNRLHSHKKEGGVAIEEFRVENVADRTHTVGAAFMGLTMECCRCHDHKYDPLPTRDYYSLSAFFDNIDERGLISFFTDAVPTPAMTLASPAQQSAIDAARQHCKQVEEAWQRYQNTEAEARFQNWLHRHRSSSKSASIAGLVSHLTLDEFGEVEAAQSLNEVGKKRPVETMASLTNTVGNNAITPRANQLVRGRFGSAIELTGDDAIVIPDAGHFRRHDPFSVSIWIWAADVEHRGVIYRRSRGWDDAGSVGYELTKEGGILSARLCHFWPGDAIAIETTHPIQPHRWTHVTVTYDGSSRAAGMNLYLDGHPVPTTVRADHLTRRIDKWNSGYQDFAIGSRYRDRGFTGGRVDEVRLFDRELSSLEAQRLFDSDAPAQLFAKDSGELSAAECQRLRSHYLSAIDDIAHDHRESLRQARRLLNEAIDATPAIMVMRESDPPRQSYILDRGVYDNRGEPVEPSTPQCLPPMDDSLPRNRLGLARWLISDDHPLTARVTVNRYWQMMFGRGLVATPEDFGNQGEIPSHPELLDWLARDFIDHGWNIRRVLKQIALSATYRQTSIVSALDRERDPENIYLARGTQPRLSAEMIRDNVLATSELLVDQVGGPPVRPYDVALAYTPMKVDVGADLYRRSLYTFWKRTSPSPVMMTFNTPSREVCRLQREVTNTPLQALVMLNGNQFIEASRAMAVRLLRRHDDDIDSIVHEAFYRLTSRPPTPDEQVILIRLLDEQRAEFESHPDRAADFLRVGHVRCPEDLPKPLLAATTVLVNSIQNLDESVRHQ